MRSNIRDEVGRTGVVIERIRIALAERDGEPHVFTRLGVERGAPAGVITNHRPEDHEQDQRTGRQQPECSETPHLPHPPRANGTSIQYGFSCTV